jgi:uncharacterized protein
MKISHHARELFSRLRSSDLEPVDPAPSPVSGPSRDPIVRRMDFGFSEQQIPRHWLGGSMVGTALANGLNLVFPEGERFFVRSVNHFLPEIDDPVLRDRVKRFFGQEGQHAREHERLFEILRGHGFEVDELVARYRHVAYDLIAPKVSAKLRLSVTAALEHFTATFAEQALANDALDQLAPPVMVELLKWHAAEEIEHKDVAYDVLQQVDDSYALRATGLVLATVVLLGFWSYLTVELLRQDPDFELRRAADEWTSRMRDGLSPSRTMPHAFLQYLAPDFHPSQTGNDELALAYLREIGRVDH